jgi:2-polyprenyl-3-methyl-5-hydroxy-6-metoxy-1,4-benzoquinol methylase
MDGATPAARDRYQREAQFFDAVAARARIAPMSAAAIDRYRHCRQAHLFAKEFMFSLVGDFAGRRVLEIGCGEGVSSVQLAALGARVTGVDLSQTSLDVARRFAEANGVSAEFICKNLETDDLGWDSYDVVWCDNILHHVVPALPEVLGKLRAMLRPGGWFIAREPVAYAGVLKALRRLVPVRVDVTPDEQPLRAGELALIRETFPGLAERYFRILARMDRVTDNLRVVARCAAVDNFLLRWPAARRLAGHAVLWARVED